MERREKKVIVESRTKTSALIATALKEIPNKVAAVISASAIGWYGPDPVIPNPQPFEEPPLPTTTSSARPAASGRTRSSPSQKPANGWSLSGQASSSATKAEPWRNSANLFGSASRLSSVVANRSSSWIHVDDLCRLYLAAIEQKEWSGVFNGVAPQPVSNRELVLTLGRRLKGRYLVPIYIPSFFLKLLLGEMSIEVLKSTTVSAAKTRTAGFQFLYPSIGSALDALL
ncbi:DUF1731 domain-containing protein [Puia sp. P3]|uniref:DUF1731 domain-containing protein n=1 Tax=Puia sp. P3 TaxID=3423952 RepID=UPI003D66EA6D